eukprot:14936181-Alexandrium_andersonii.AAC.1
MERATTGPERESERERARERESERATSERANHESSRIQLTLLYTAECGTGYAASPNVQPDPPSHHLAGGCWSRRRRASRRPQRRSFLCFVFLVVPKITATSKGKFNKLNI